MAQSTSKKDSANRIVVAFFTMSLPRDDVEEREAYTTVPNVEQMATEDQTFKLLTTMAKEDKHPVRLRPDQYRFGKSSSNTSENMIGVDP